MKKVLLMLVVLVTMSGCAEAQKLLNALSSTIIVETNNTTPVTVNLRNPIQKLDSVTITTKPEGATVSFAADNTQATFTPDGVYVGKTTTVVEATLGEDTFEIFIYVTLTPTNTVPVARPDNAKTDEDTPVYIDVLANDEDADGQALVIREIKTAKGSAAVIGGKIYFDPNGDFDGIKADAVETYTFTYEAVDTEGGAAEANVTVDITGINDAPVALLSGMNRVDGCINGDSFSRQIETYDPEGDSYTISGNDSCGFISVDSDGLATGTCTSITSPCKVDITLDDGTNVSTTPLWIQNNNIRYVAPVSSGNGKGSSWRHAMNHVTNAISQSNSAGGEDVWLKMGTYKPVSWTTNFITIQTGGILYGSFAGHETMVGERSLDARKTILNGDSDHIPGPSDFDANYVIRIENSSGVDGLTITGGHGDTNYGGILCDYSNEISIRNTVIRDNNTRSGGLGGAIYTYRCGLDIDNVIIHNNYSDNYHIYFYDNQNLNSFTARNLIMHNNRHSYNSYTYAYIDEVKHTTIENSSFSNPTNNGHANNYGFWIEEDSDSYNTNITHISMAGTQQRFYLRDGTVKFENNLLDYSSSPVFSSVSSFSEEGTCRGAYLSDVWTAASGENFLNQDSSCIDAAKDATATAVYEALGLDWMNLTTDLDGFATDVSYADPGYHHDPARVWIIDFYEDNGVLHWQTNENATDCRIFNDHTGETIDETNEFSRNEKGELKFQLPNGSYALKNTVETQFRLNCDDPHGPWSAEARLTADAQ